MVVVVVVMAAVEEVGLKSEKNWEKEKVNRKDQEKEKRKEKWK